MACTAFGAFHAAFYRLLLARMHERTPEVGGMPGMAWQTPGLPIPCMSEDILEKNDKHGMRGHARTAEGGHARLCLGSLRGYLEHINCCQARRVRARTGRRWACQTWHA